MMLVSAKKRNFEIPTLLVLKILKFWNSYPLVLGQKAVKVCIKLFIHFKKAFKINKQFVAIEGYNKCYSIIEKETINKRIYSQ